MNRVTQRTFAAAIRENKGRLAVLPDKHYLAVAWNAIALRLPRSIQEADPSPARLIISRKSCDGSCFRATYRRSTVSLRNDLKWFLTASEQRLLVGFETPLSSARTVSFDQFDQNSSQLVESLLSIPAELGLIKLKVDNVDVILPRADEKEPEGYRFSRAPNDSLQVSLAGPAANQTSSPDLLTWVHDAACHLAPIFNLLAPPCDVDIKGSDASEAVGYPEGARKYRIHKARERSHALVAKAKQRHARMNGGRLPCEVCGFDFIAVYGRRGAEYAEAHHRLPLCGSNDDRESRVDDLAIVCANCHRMLHRSPFMTVEDLKASIRR